MNGAEGQGEVSWSQNLKQLNQADRKELIRTAKDLKKTSSNEEYETKILNAAKTITQKPEYAKQQAIGNDKPSDFFSKIGKHMTWGRTSFNPLKKIAEQLTQIESKSINSKAPLEKAQISGTQNSTIVGNQDKTSKTKSSTKALPNRVANPALNKEAYNWVREKIDNNIKNGKHKIILLDFPDPKYSEVKFKKEDVKEVLYHLLWTEKSILAVNAHERGNQEYILKINTDDQFEEDGTKPQLSERDWFTRDFMQTFKKDTKEEKDYFNNIIALKFKFLMPKLSK